VGVVGYTLGGGMSWYARRYGLASSRVLAVELVTADGEHIRADRRHHADVFWAVKGGGGSFGIVTHLEFELVQVGAIQAGGLWFPVERASEVLHAWREWAPQLPEGVTTSARILNVPPMPHIPEPIRGKSFALVLVSVLGDEEEANAHLAPLRALGPVMDTVKPTEVGEMTQLAMDPPTPVPAKSAHAVFDELTAEAVDVIVAQATAAKTLVVAHLTLGGGAMGRPVGGGAVTHIDAPVTFFAAAIAPPPLAELAEAEMATFEEALEPFVAQRAYLNLKERAADPRTFWDPATYARLQAVKHTVDPHGYIVANHGVTA
jgi:FAD/FMN-containing dehydrogenase